MCTTLRIVNPMGFLKPTGLNMRVGIRRGKPSQRRACPWHVQVYRSRLSDFGLEALVFKCGCLRFEYVGKGLAKSAAFRSKLEAAEGARYQKHVSYKCFVSRADGHPRMKEVRSPPTYMRTYIHTCMHACIHTYRQTNSPT